MGDPILNAVVISDLHCGCQFALCPDTVHLNGGGVYRASKEQRQILKCWNYFWDEWVPKVTREEPFVVVVNGDVMDNRHHDAVTQISRNTADQANIAYELLYPVRKQCADMYFIGGTEAHSGPSADLEEKLGERLDTVRDEKGNRCRYDLYLKLGKCLCHFTHHIGTTGSSHYETSALMGEFTNVMVDSERWGYEPVNVVVRSHRHIHTEIRVPTKDTYGYCFVTAGWQLKTPFAFKTPGGRVRSPMIGGSLIRQGDEEFYTRHMTWTLPRSKTEVPRT